MVHTMARRPPLARIAEILHAVTIASLPTMSHSRSLIPGTSPKRRRGREKQLLVPLPPVDRGQYTSAQQILPVKSEPSDLQPQTHLYTMHVNPAPDIPTVPITDLPGTLQSMEILAQEVHEHNLRRRAELIEGTGTDPAYARHLKAYVKWWDEDQLRRVEEAAEAGTCYVLIPAHPITATKAAIFLNYELTRPKKTRGAGGEGEGTVGVSSIKQTISALEHYRYHHQRDPEYRSCADAKIPLRDMPEITTIERSAMNKEPKRLAESQDMKRDGTFSQTFSEAQLVTIATMFFRTPYDRNAGEIHLAMRDRAMLLFSTAMAFRGDDTRSILVSDLSVKDIRIPELGVDRPVKGLLVFSNNGKVNKNGRVDIVGTFRHRFPHLCAIGSLALYFFAKFHIHDTAPYEFAPDFDNPRYGPSGYRKWYELVLFPGHHTPYAQMTPENHRRRFSHVKLLCEIFFRKVNHAGRPFAATLAVENGASVESVKAIGLWSTPGSFACYNSALPLDAMVALAGFNGRQMESYFVPREKLEPPQSLLSSIFPWIEDEERAFQERKSRLGAHARDASLDGFLDLLRFLRTVLLQDAAVLYEQDPEFVIFSYAPFNTLAFREFARSSTVAIKDAEVRARLQFENLPEKLAISLRNALEGTIVQQAQTKTELHDANTDFSARLDAFEETIHTVLRVISGGNARKRKEVEEAISFSSQGVQRRRLVHHESSASQPPVSIEAAPPIQGATTLPPPCAPLYAPTTVDQDRSLIQVVSGNGNVYSPRTFPMASAPSRLHSAQMKALTELEKVVAPDVLKHHTFEWEEKAETWLPHFSGFWSPSGNTALTMADIWREHEMGIGGRISIKQMKEVWGARWKRNQGKIKTESARRSKIVDLISRIADQDGWDAQRALLFLETRYPFLASSADPHLRNLRAFIEYLQKNKSATEQIVAESKLFN